MSLLQVIEKAALSLTDTEQRELLVFLSGVLEHAPVRPVTTTVAPGVSVAGALHPELLQVLGIIPAEANADEVHEYRLRKHS
jgi:hypothetical protein